LRESQNDDAFSAETFLRTKRLAGFGEQCLLNHSVGCAYADVFVVSSEGLDVFLLRNVAASGIRLPTDNFMFGYRTFVEWMSGS
jgi:hypothetical protein